VSNFRSIGQGVRGLRLPQIGGFPLTLNVALTTVLRTNVLHCDFTTTCNNCQMTTLSYLLLALCDIVILAVFKFWGSVLWNCLCIVLIVVSVVIRKHGTEWVVCPHHSNICTVIHHCWSSVVSYCTVSFVNSSEGFKWT